MGCLRCRRVNLGRVDNNGWAGWWGYRHGQGRLRCCRNGYGWAGFKSRNCGRCSRPDRQSVIWCVCACRGWDRRFQLRIQGGHSMIDFIRGSRVIIQNGILNDPGSNRSHLLLGIT